MAFDSSINFGDIDMKMNTTVLDEISSFMMIRLFFLLNWIEVLTLHWSFYSGSTA